jgi:hypothetical protein
MSTDLEIVELLPAREELVFMLFSSFSNISHNWQFNSNHQFGLLNVNEQQNVISVG